MAVTVVLLRGEPDARREDAPRLTFDGTRIVLGRGRECDVRLPDTRVARRHASIRAEHAGYALFDEGSVNGTFVEAVRLAPGAPHVLKDGDLVRIGPFWLEVVIDPSLPTSEPSATARTIALELMARRLRERGVAVDPRVHVETGPDHGRSLRLAEDGRGYVLGGAEECDLRLSDPKLEEQHVVVTRRSFSVFVRSLASGQASLGRESLVGDHEYLWKPGVPLVCGDCRLGLDEPVPAALAALEEEAEEPLLGEAIPPRPRSTRTARPTTDVVTPPSPADRTPPTAAGAERSWTHVDLGVLVAAFVVLALSVSGLVWLLKK